MTSLTTGVRTLWADLSSTKDPFRLSVTTGAGTNNIWQRDMSPLNCIRFSNTMPSFSINIIANDVAPLAAFQPSPFYATSTIIQIAPSLDVRKYIQYSNWTGNYKVVGKVQINTVNSAGKWVYIFPVASPGLCIGAQYTDSTGNFAFYNLSYDKYVIYAMDPNFSYNGKLYENIQSVSQ